MVRWQKEQEAEVHQMVEEARAHIDESGFAKKEDWFPNLAFCNWVERYICDRFRYMLRWRWVEAFAMMDDETLLVRPKGEQAAKYLIFVRDYARRYMNEHY